MSEFTQILFIIFIIFALLSLSLVWLCAIIRLCRYNGFYTYYDDEKEITDADGNRLTPSGWVDKDGDLIHASF